MLKLIVSIIGAAIALSPSAIGFKAVNGTDNSPRYGSSFQGGTIQYREDRTIYYSTDKQSSMKILMAFRALFRQCLTLALSKRRATL